MTPGEMDERTRVVRALRFFLEQRMEDPTVVRDGGDVGFGGPDGEQFLVDAEGHIRISGKATPLSRKVAVFERDGAWTAKSVEDEEDRSPAAKNRASDAAPGTGCSPGCTILLLVVLLLLLAFLAMAQYGLENAEDPPWGGPWTREVGAATRSEPQAIVHLGA